jgi:serine phosphatase RsbU (regulator of sigma subunit)/serine/threonine protein kinase
MAQEQRVIDNRYQDLGLLGEGGMGLVYRVRDTITQRECALKILSRKIASEEAFLQFKQEFWYMSRLNHPHIIHVYEYGVLDDQAPYFTMELVPGQELSDLNRVDVNTAYRVLIQATKALGFIHSRLLVHSDIKPENLRIREDGTLKLMDFGLMQPLGNRSNGQLTGTVAYMPPEVPQRGVINESSDIYSLGVVAYELLAGVQPFIGTTILEVLKAHINSEPAPLKTFRSDLPDELIRIVRKMMARDQADRYPNSSELLSDLAAASGLKEALESDEERSSYLSSHVLVGRDSELKVLKDLQAEVNAGTSRAIFVSAPAGVGKSRLIEEFKIHSQLAEIPFAQGICNEQGMSSYEPVVNALNQILPLTPPLSLLKHGPILAHLLPRLIDQGLEPKPDFDPRNQKIALFESIVEWLREVAAQKKYKSLVLFIDDLHWSDLASIDLLNFLIRELGEARVMIMGSFRDDELPPNSPLWQTIEEQAAQQLTILPFTPGHVAELIEKMLRHVDYKPDFIPYFYGATSGNAFFIREMMRYLMEEQLIYRDKATWIIPDSYTEWKLPTSIGDTIQHRLKRLSPEAVALIEMIAVVGKRIELPLLEHLCGSESENLFALLEELIERQFLLREGDLFLFPHDRVRETLYSSLDTSNKRPIHQSVGEWLEERGEAVSVLAYHFKNGQDKVKASRYLIEAGEAAPVRMEATLLMHEGIAMLEKLFGLPEQEELLEKHRRKLAWVSYMIQPFICAETCEKLIESLQDSDVPLEKQIEFESILISSYTMIGQNTKALAKAESLLPQLEPGTVPYGLVLFGRLNALLTRGEFRQLVQEMEEAATILKRNFADLHRQLIWAYAFCSFIREDAIAWLGEPVGKDEYATIPLEIGQQYDFLDLVFWSYYPEVVRNSLTGRYPAIRTVSDEIFALIKKMGRPIQHENRFQVCLAFAAIEYGDIAEGERYAHKVVALGERMKNPHQQASGKILEGMIAEHRLHLDDAVAFFSEAVDLSRKSETDQLLPALYRLVGVHLKQKDLVAAEALLEEAHALAQSKKRENPYHQIHTWRLKAQLENMQDPESERISEWYGQSIALAEATDNPMQSALSHGGLGSWYVEREDLHKAESHLEAAAKAWRSLHLPQRQVEEQLRWVKQQLSQQKPLAFTPHDQLKSLVLPETAQELGYRMVDLLKTLQLPSLHLGGGADHVSNLSERIEKMERVNQFSQIIMSNLSLQNVLHDIIDYVVDISQADRGLLMIKDESGNMMPQVVRTRDDSHSDKAADKNRLLGFSRSFTKKVMETGVSLWIQDAQSDSEFSQQASIMALDLRTIICVPLKREEEIIGLLYLDRQAINQTFSEQDLELVQSMATFATISLINAHLHKQLQERTERLSMLNELSRALATTIDFEELLVMVLEFCLKISKAEIGYMFIARDFDKVPESFAELECQASRDDKGKPLDSVKVSHSIIQKVLSEKEGIDIVDMQEDSLMASQKSIMALDLKSVICAPIFGKEEALRGVVYVSSQAVNHTFSPRDRELIESIVLQVGLDIENRHLMEIRKKQELLDQELSFARSIQSSMLPDYIPDIPSLDIIGFSESAAAVGGDYYDYFKISDFEFGMAIGDVNGHGVSAGLLMSMAKSCLFVQGKIDPGVLAMMEALNGMIYGGTKERLFMTFIYSIFQLQNNTVTLSSAGHHLPYFYRAATGEMEPIQVKPTYPLGVREKVKFNEVTVQLAPHDILVYYTDGIVEAHTPDGEEFGFERLEQLIIANREKGSAGIQEALLQAYRDWVGDQEAEDDMSLVVVKARPVEPPAPEAPAKKQKLKTGFLTLINR